MSPDGEKYLIEQKLVSYAPSVSILLEQLRSPKPTRSTLQAFANSSYNNQFLRYVNNEATSVASFFISRVDTEVDRRLDEIGTPAALALKGRAAVAQAQVAYARFGAAFQGPRWDALVARGARVQRPLWASTSTKNPAYPDTSYVDLLIGPDTVNTMPEETIDAFLDHGRVARTVDTDPAAASATLAALAAVGVDLDDVGQVLEDQGVAAFAKAFDELIGALDAKADGRGAG